MGVSSLRLGSSGAFEVERRGRCLTLESLSRSRVRVCIKLLTAPDFYRTPEKACLFPRRAERQTSTARTLSAGRCTVLQPPIGGLQLRGHTIVVFTSDNGGERFSKTWPFTGMKQELLEGGLRIPSIVRWPGRIAAGSGSEQVMITIDWVPTLLAAVGTSPDAAYPSDGEDLGPIVTGRAAPHARKLYWRYKAGSQRALRDGDWKYLRIAGNEFLFDVVKDPRERANLKDRQK